MTMHTKDIYLNYAKHNMEPEEQFRGGYPEWKLLDKISDSWFVRLGFVALYVLFVKDLFVFIISKKIKKLLTGLLKKI